MRIGVDASCWSNGRGYGRFTRELLRALVSLGSADEWVCFLDEQSARAFDLAGPNVRVQRVRLTASPARAASAEGHRSAADMLRLTAAVWRARPEVFFSPSVYTYFPLPPGLAAVVTIHDTIVERHPLLTLPTARARMFWRAKVGLAVRQARLLVTVSEYSARELGEVLGVPRERIRVVMEAPAQAFRPSGPAEIERAAARYGLAPADRWFTYVGGFNPHKRVAAMVRAHAEVVRLFAAAPPHLVLVGRTDDDVFHKNVEEIRGAIAACGTDRLVHWTGFVEDDQLRHLHSGAVALILVSEAEGFGLPAVEAAACGAPVIATRASPLPEILEGGGLFIDPRDDGALVAGMRTLLEDEPARRALGERARERARRLDWESSARTTLATLREAAA